MSVRTMHVPIKKWPFSEVEFSDGSEGQAEPTMSDPGGGSVTDSGGLMGVARAGEPDPTAACPSVPSLTHVTVPIPAEREGDLEILGRFYFVKPDGTMFSGAIVLTPQDYCVPQWPADAPKRVCDDVAFADAIATRVQQFAITVTQALHRDIAWLASVKARCAAVLARKS